MPFACDRAGIQATLEKVGQSKFYVRENWLKEERRFWLLYKLPSLGKKMINYYLP